MRHVNQFSAMGLFARLRHQIWGPIAAALAVLLVGPACAGAQALPEGVQEAGGHRFRLVSVADGLEHPWAIAFLPGGDILVTERPGRLRVIRNGKLLETPISGLPSIRVGSQGGLLDVVPHPNFASNRLIYISYSKPSADGETGTTAIIRGRFEGTALTNVEEIFEAVAWVKGQGHYGSRIAFDRNGYVFITVGDRQVPPTGNLEAHPAQDLSNHQGTVIRLHDDGRVPADNPFVGRANARPEIWSYGHRNGQGLAIHPETGDIWESEHGPQGGDELNLVRPGLNYGWPVIGYGVNYGTGGPIHATSSRQGMEQPVRYWVPSIGTSGLMIYTGDVFPNWKGNAFLGGMNGNASIARVTLDGQRAVNSEVMLGTSLRVRDIRQSPSGDIYLALDNRGGARTAVVKLERVD